MQNSTNKPIRRLTCCCCGESTQGRQHWNRDTGFGICRQCADTIAARGRESPEEMLSYYGHRGYHYAID